MSTLVYATVPRPRKAKGAAAGAAAVAPSETVSTFVESVAALVPAEVLALHAMILSLTTETAAEIAQATGEEVVVTTITEPRILFWTFFGLVATSIVLYVVPLCRKLRSEKKQCEWADLIRMLIPPASFVVWAMLQKTTAFDAVAPGLTEVPRLTIALFGAVFLTLGAATFSYKKPEGGGNPAALSRTRQGGGGLTPAPGNQVAGIEDETAART